jgi:putative ABC transport system permease protein
MANKEIRVSPIMKQQPFFELPDSMEFVTSIYDVLEGKLPEKEDELVLVISKENMVTKVMLDKLGLSKDSKDIMFKDAIGKEYKMIMNDDFYEKKDGKFFPSSTSKYNDLYNSKNAKTLKIVGIIRVNKDAPSEIFGEGVAYLPSMTTFAIDNAKNSDITKAQIQSDTSVLGGVSEPSTTFDKKQVLQMLGEDNTPASISIYPKDFDSKEKIREYLDNYNKSKSQEDKIVYSDLAQSITGLFDTIINTIAIVLVAFAAISLIVSSIMIGIITYVSVLERTKEIGILRSIGARKKDISRVFNAETIIVGFVAGLIGVGVAYIITIPINMIVESLVPAMKNVADLSIEAALTLISISIVLTYIAGLIPSKIAANKNPVVALRTE